MWHLTRYSGFVKPVLDRGNAKKQHRPLGLSDMAPLNKLIKAEIERISTQPQVDTLALESFAQFVIAKYKLKDPKPKKLTLAELKSAVYKYFKVTSTAALKKSGEFKMATDGMEVNLSNRSGWETLYRTFIGILPEEDGETGEDCLNGINIFKYALPWRTFGLDPKTATTDDVRKAYRQLSKIYHPDTGKPGNAAIFERLTIFYKSLVADA